VTPDGDSYREPRNEERDRVKPIWNIVTTREEWAAVDHKLGWDHEGLHLGYYKRSTRRSYDLGALRDASDREHGVRQPSAEELGRIRRFVIDELNRRSREGRLGSRLEGVLQNGTEQTSYWCPQNAVVLGAWLTLLVALVAVPTMFVRPRSVVDQAPAKPIATADRCDDPESQA